MPITDWSLPGGDLRIPHFVGIHALQVLPLLAMRVLAAARRWPRLRDEGVRIRLVLIAAGHMRAWGARPGQRVGAARRRRRGRDFGMRLVSTMMDTNPS
jgi:hypothetical protein